jgi:hypothetical protein
MAFLVYLLLSSLKLPPHTVFGTAAYVVAFRVYRTTRKQQRVAFQTREPPTQSRQLPMILAINLGKASPSFPLQVGIRGGMPKRAQHRHHLAFVVETVRDHVQQNKRRTAQLPKPSFRTFCQRRV